jgi:hypothetical protein
MAQNSFILGSGKRVGHKPAGSELDRVTLGAGDALPAKI